MNGSDSWEWFPVYTEGPCVNCAIELGDHTVEELIECWLEHHSRSET